MKDRDNCPQCKISLRGQPIKPEHQHYFGTTHYSTVLGISDGDSIHTWKCPACGFEWKANL